MRGELLGFVFQVEIGQREIEEEEQDLFLGERNLLDILSEMKRKKRQTTTKQKRMWKWLKNQKRHWK